MDGRKWCATAALCACAVLLLSGPPVAPGSRWLPSGSSVATGSRWLLAVLALLLVGRACAMFMRPMERLCAPADVGYAAATAGGGRARTRTANDVRRRRKVGALPPVYPNGWYRLLDSRTLRTGDVKDVSAVGSQLVVFRAEDGVVHVLDAYCPHLGASLAVGGRVVGSCIECPFHGWRFHGGSGKCVKIPYAERVPEVAGVRRWLSREVNGLILVWFHCDEEAPRWTVPEQPEISGGSWVYRGRTEHFVNAHIQEIPENAADIAHLGHLHRPGIVSGADLRYTDSRIWRFVRHDWKVEWTPEPEPNGHCSTMVVDHALFLFGRRFPPLDVHVVARQVGPGVVFLLFHHRFLGRGVILHCVTPVEPLLQCVSHTIFYQASIPPPVPNFILRAESIQFERDVMIWNNKTYLSRPLLVKEDSAVQKHRRWFSQFYSKNSPRFSFQKDTCDF